MCTVDTAKISQLVFLSYMQRLNWPTEFDHSLPRVSFWIKKRRRYLMKFAANIVQLRDFLMMHGSSQLKNQRFVEFFIDAAIQNRKKTAYPAETIGNMTRLS
jgi:hypothetical protein